MTHDIDLDALTALEQGLPPAPWTVCCSQPAPGVRTEGGWEVAYTSYTDSGPAVAAFIAAARNNWSALLSALTATRAELETASAEIERLKVERGEALLWSPWNDHDVLFEQWAKRRGGAGNEASCDCHPLVPQDFKDAVAKTAAERCPEKYGALAAGAGTNSGHCGLCGSEDCPGVPGKGCTPGPFEVYRHDADKPWPTAHVPDVPESAHESVARITASKAAGAGDGEQDTATCGCSDSCPDCTGKPCACVRCLNPDPAPASVQGAADGEAQA